MASDLDLTAAAVGGFGIFSTAHIHRIDSTYRGIRLEDPQYRDAPKKVYAFIEIPLV